MELSEFLSQYKNDESIIYFCDYRIPNFSYYYQDEKSRETIRSNAQMFLNESGVIFASLDLLGGVGNSLFVCELALRRQIRTLFLEWSISKGAETVEDLFKPFAPIEKEFCCGGQLGYKCGTCPRDEDYGFE